MSSEAKKMTLRIQTSEGTSRVEAVGNEPTATLFERVQTTLQLSSFAFTLHTDRARQHEILSSKSRTLVDYNLKHGDMLYLNPVNGAVLFDQSTTNAETGTVKHSKSDTSVPAGFGSKPQEDEVDLELHKDSGRIQRPKDEKLCRHSSKGCCVHCSPLEPWDENYLKEQNIRHMSFHTYLRKLSGGKSFVVLDEPSYKIKPGCKDHVPWPRGICSACRPGDVTLMRQTYRHVDNIALQNAAVVERFLAEWRATGHQRLGVMYGYYERHTALPLAIRATVAAIYEPPQSGSRDSIQLHDDPNQGIVDDIAKELGLTKVGWIFTDLLPDVSKVRGADTHFLSAQECIMAAHYQNAHPNPCRYASSGYYGSKFVTVCVTGDSEKQVHLEGYQVSLQCAALVRDNVLLPTRDAPELGFVRDSSPAQYVPNVHYKEKDSYGNEVTVRAGPVPVEYLLVDVPVGVSGAGAGAGVAAGAALGAGVAAGAALGVGAGPLFSPACNFPPANRVSQQQTLQALHQHVNEHEDFLEAMSDLHVLVFLATNAHAAVPLEEVTSLAGAVRRRGGGGAAAAGSGGGAAAAWRGGGGGGWRTLAALAAAAADAPHWTCRLCTYHNQPDAHSCDMCAMPRNSM